MSQTGSDAPVQRKAKSNVYTAAVILSAVFLIGGLVLLYMQLTPYLTPPR
jgi:hypothetical protein